MGRESASIAQSRSTVYFRLAPEEDKKKEGKRYQVKNKVWMKGSPFQTEIPVSAEAELLAKGSASLKQKETGKQPLWQTELQVTAYLAYDVISYNCSWSEYHKSRDRTTSPALGPKRFPERGLLEAFMRQPLTSPPRVTKPLLILWSAHKYPRAPRGT